MQHHAKQFRYYDGSGNGYIIKQGNFTYEPVTPERSSSGTYSGGKAVSRAISEKEVATLEALFNKAVTSANEHQDDRAMMTGLVVIENGEDTLRVVLKPGSLAKKELEDFFVELRTR